MSQIQTEISNTRVNVTIWIKINLFYVHLNKCRLFITKHSRMASIKTLNLNLLAEGFSRFLCIVLHFCTDLVSSIFWIFFQKYYVCKDTGIGSHYFWGRTRGKCVAMFLPCSSVDKRRFSLSLLELSFKHTLLDSWGKN